MAQTTSDAPAVEWSSKPPRFSPYDDKGGVGSMNYILVFNRNNGKMHVCAVRTYRTHADYFLADGKRFIDYFPDSWLWTQLPAPPTEG